MTLRPTANQIGRELEALGYVIFGRRAYIQKDDNCFEIASHLADIFGYAHPKSREQLMGLLYANRNRQNYGGSPPYIDKPSKAYFVIRTPNYLDRFSVPFHVVFELDGEEFNYGPGMREGFSIEQRIPLREKTKEERTCG